MADRRVATVRILITCGDCNGIGPEVMTKALLDKHCADLPDTCEISIIGHPETLREYGSASGLPLGTNDKGIRVGSGTFALHSCDTYAPLELGRASAASGRLALEALERSVQLLLAGAADAVVTMPVSKFVLHQAGATFPGQTEFYARACGVGNPMMILCADSVRVALATIHLPLRRVADAVTPAVVAERLETLAHSLKHDFGSQEARIAVLGLNPHAGEDGALGEEETKYISPAIRLMQSRGFAVEGPFPADGFFAHGAFRNYDGVLAMYHDQGLVPLKLLADGAGVNVTAGLPLVRTSPDHGTAFPLAGKGVADARSAQAALAMAERIVRMRKNSNN